VSPLLTAAEVARRLGVPTSWVYRETRANRIPHVRVGRYCRYREAAIEEWVTSLERGPGPRRKQQPPGGPPDADTHGQAE
jgi:excisionase family DNA binding protein